MILFYVVCDGFCILDFYHNASESVWRLEQISNENVLLRVSRTTHPPMRTQISKKNRNYCYYKPSLPSTFYKIIFGKFDLDKCKQ